MFPYNLKSSERVSVAFLVMMKVLAASLSIKKVVKKQNREAKNVRLSLYMIQNHCRDIFFVYKRLMFVNQ